VLELASGLGLDVAERSIGRVDLLGADEVFLTGSGAGIITARSLDGCVLGAGQRGPVTAQLSQLHRELAEREVSVLVP
jgi:branched-chain amino acid aminotransferase